MHPISQDWGWSDEREWHKVRLDKVPYHVGFLANNEFLLQWIKSPIDGYFYLCCRVVEAVVNYAYTGRIRISTNEVSQCYLMAHNLGCSDLISWCASLMISRQVTSLSKHLLCVKACVQVWACEHVLLFQNSGFRLDTGVVVGECDSEHGPNRGVFATHTRPNRWSHHKWGIHSWNRNRRNEITDSMHARKRIRRRCQVECNNIMDKCTNVCQWSKRSRGLFRGFSAAIECRDVFKKFDHPIGIRQNCRGVANFMQVVLNLVINRLTFSWRVDRSC